MVKPKIVLLIFVSGKVVLTGAKVEHVVESMTANSLQSREEIYEAFGNIYDVLRQFKKG